MHYGNWLYRSGGKTKNELDSLHHATEIWRKRNYLWPKIFGFLSPKSLWTEYCLLHGQQTWFGGTLVLPRLLQSSWVMRGRVGSKRKVGTQLEWHTCMRIKVWLLCAANKQKHCDTKDGERARPRGCGWWMHAPRGCGCIPSWLMDAFCVALHASAAMN